MGNKFEDMDIEIGKKITKKFLGNKIGLPDSKVIEEINNEK